ncbi:MAG: hypothetical protein HOQ36_18195 [Nocardia sp.]|nr:hypothetical protein [Nocardia sp.]
MNTEVLPPAERRDMVRRLVALCHIVNDLVEITETGAVDGGLVPEALYEHAQRIQAVVRDVVVDLVANGHAGHSDAA